MPDKLYAKGLTKKDTNISDMVRWKVTPERVEELKGCAILCCRCHREVHYPYE